MEQNCCLRKPRENRDVVMPFPRLRADATMNAVIGDQEVKRK